MTLLSIQNETGHTPLHLAAWYKWSGNIVRAMLNKLDTKQRMKLLTIKCSYTKYTPLHMAAYYNKNGDMVTALLDKLDIEQRMTLLSMKDGGENIRQYTPLHLAAQYNGYGDMVTALLDKLDIEQRMTLLSIQNETGHTPLHLAAWYKWNGNIVRAMLNKLDTKQRMKLLSIKCSYTKYTPLHMAAYYNKSCDMVTALLDKLDIEQRMTLLSMKDGGENIRQYTPLHLAAQYNGNGDIVTTLLDKLDIEQRMTLLSMKDGGENIRQYTPLHLAAQYNGNGDIVTALLDKLDIEQRMILLSMKDATEYTPLHVAARYNENAAIVTVMLDRLDSEQKVTLLSESFRDVRGYTPLHVAARYNENTDILTALFDKLDTEQSIKLLIMKAWGEDEYTPLHIAAKFSQNADVVTALLDKLKTEQRLTLLTMKESGFGYTPLHVAVKFNQKADIVFVLLDKLETEQRLTLLTMKARDGYTPLHVAAKYNKIEVVNSVLLKSLDRKQTMMMLTLQDKHNNTPLHLAAQFIENFDTIYQMLLSKVDKPQRMELLLRMNKTGHTPVHHAAERHKDTYSLPAMCDSLGNERIITILSMLETVNKEMVVGFLNYLADQAVEKVSILLWQDEHGQNILHLAAAINHTKFIRKVLSSQDTEEINQAIQKRDSSGLIPYYVTKDKETQRLLAWAETQTDCYPLITPPRIVIFYSDVDRSSAQEESDSFAEILPTFSMIPVVKLNPTKEEIYSIIRENQKGPVSALIVVIMSHGDSGVVRVRDGDMSINTILKQMNSTQLINIPKILIIQACQAKVLSPDHYDGAATANESNIPNATADHKVARHIRSESMLDASPKTDTKVAAEPKPQAAAVGHNQVQESRLAAKHFDMSGPDMIVLAATINKQTATRNLMIPILAKHLKTINDDDDLHSVFLKTVSSLRRDVPAQVPEYRTTMKYKICLKKIFKSEMEYKSSVYLTYAQQFKQLFRK